MCVGGGGGGGSVLKSEIVKVSSYVRVTAVMIALTEVKMGSFCEMILSCFQLYCFMRARTELARLDSVGYVLQKFGKRSPLLSMSEDDAYDICR